ncbi:DoxX family protein [soil metagenome]
MINFNNRTDLALTLLRVATGIVFILHGAQKVLGLFGGPGLDGFAQWSATMGIPSWLAYAAAFFELIGGLLLISGFGASMGALLGACVMAGAIWFVHLDKGFFAQNGGYEYALLLLINCIVIFLAYGNCWPMASCSTKGKKDSCC